MPESLREAGQAVARLPADGTGSLRIDLGLPGPDCATDRQEAATALRQQLPAIANIGLSVILAGLADDGTLTLPPRSRRHLLALAIQLYDLGLDVTLVSD